MSKKPTYEELEQRTQELEQPVTSFHQMEDTLHFIETRQSLIEYTAKPHAGSTSKPGSGRSGDIRGKSC